MYQVDSNELSHDRKIAKKLVSDTGFEKVKILSLLYAFLCLFNKFPKLLVFVTPL